MKLFKLLILVLLSKLSFSQPFDYDRENFVLKSLLYENSSGEKGLTTYINNSQDIIYKAVWQQLNKQRFSENFFLYKNENLVKLYRTFSDSLTSVKTFEYNEKGQLEKEVFSRSNGKKGYAEYIYDDEGKQTGLNCKGLNGWFFGMITFEYDIKGKKTSGKILKEGSQIGTIHFEYSEEGNLMKEYWDFPNRWNQTFSYRYSKKTKTNFANTNPLLNIPKGYRIKKENYTYNGKLGGPSYFTYIEKGRLFEKIFERNDTFKTVTHFNYDDSNMLRASNRKYSDGKQAYFTFKYNDDRQIIEKSYIRTDGVKGKESFLYDINGKLIAARYDNMDDWLSGNLFFKHDMYDKVTGADFISDNGSAAKITFFYNDEGLTTKIRWDFSYGDFQIYTFQYEKAE